MRSIKTSEIVAVVKDSKIDYDCRRLGLTPLKLFKFYKRSGYPESKIHDIQTSHDLQRQGKRVIASLFTPEQLISRGSFKPAMLRNWKLVVTFGGDNHMQYIARYLGKTPILGINADPPRSEGALTQITVNQLNMAVEAMGKGNYKIEEWNRFNVKLGGQVLPFPVLCEAFLGEHQVENMSRLAIRSGDHSFLHKGSGMLVYTGAGSTGWAHAVEHITFEKTSCQMRYITMHPYIGKLSPAPDSPHAFFARGKTLSITSMNDAEGVIILDALERYAFPEGSTARIVKGPFLRLAIPQI